MGIDRDNLRIWLGYHADGVKSATFSPDNASVITAAGNEAVLWDTIRADKLQTFRGHRDSVNSAVVSSDSSLVITASNDRSARMFDAVTGVCLKAFNAHDGPVHSATFSPDGKLVLTASMECSALFEVATGAQMQALNHENCVLSV